MATKHLLLLHNDDKTKGLARFANPNLPQLQILDSRPLCTIDKKNISNINISKILIILDHQMSSFVPLPDVLRRLPRAHPRARTIKQPTHIPSASAHPNRRSKVGGPKAKDPGHNTNKRSTYSSPDLPQLQILASRTLQNMFKTNEISTFSNHRYHSLS